MAKGPMSWSYKYNFNSDEFYVKNVSDFKTQINDITIYYNDNKNRHLYVLPYLYQH